MKLEITERDVLLIESALHMRARALENIAAENTRRAPDMPELARDACQRARELMRIADDIGSQLNRRDTIPAMPLNDAEYLDLISTGANQ